MRPPVTVQNCEDEPIHIPGYIQSHGYLLAIRYSDKTIVSVSKNFEEFLSVDQLLGQPIEKLQLLLEKDVQAFQDIINASKYRHDPSAGNPYSVEIKGKPFDLMLSESAEDVLLLEFEPADRQEADLDMQILLGKSILEIQKGTDLSTMLQAMAQQVREVTGYDRIMIYKFWEDWHGEVVAEDKEDGVEAFMGLHFPASDIPSQARELYLKNLTRIIVDVQSEPVELLSQHDEPLDLSYSEVRAVSPIHIQYLKNMEVGASFSISLVHKGKLWGLIACHNSKPRYLSYNTRKTCRLIAQLLSTALEYINEHESHQIRKKYEGNAETLRLQMQSEWDIVDGLINKDTTLLNINDASGAALYLNDEIHTLGITPDREELLRLQEWLAEQRFMKTYETRALGKKYDAGSGFSEIASGILVGVISNEFKEYIVWFKPECITTVSWAGKPAKDIDHERGQLSPRSSFAEWKETVKGHSDPWNDLEITIAEKILDEAIYIINKKANEIRKLNEELRRAYEELDTFSYTISHDLRTPLTVITSYLAILLDGKDSLTESQVVMLSKAQDNAKKMTAMISDILAYSKIRDVVKEKAPVNIEAMIEELEENFKAAYSSREVELYCKGEYLPVMGNRVMINQVFSNLIDNAIKYSKPESKALVSISAQDTGSEVQYSISDSGIGMEDSQSSKIFELFYRLRNTGPVEGSGVGLAIVKRIIEKHNGRIWVKSAVGEGTTFYLAFPKE